MKKIVWLMCFTILISQGIMAQGAGGRDRLVSRSVIFQGERQISSSVDNTLAWQPVGRFVLDPQLLVSGGGSGNYKWRLHLFYNVDGQQQADLAVQVRVLVNSVQNPTFTLQWDKGRAGMRSAYTNWLRPDFLGLNANASLPVLINIKNGESSLTQTIRLQLVELEVWEELVDPLSSEHIEAELKQAAAPVLRPNIGTTAPVVTPPPTKNRQQNGDRYEVARETGLAFLEAAALGDRGAMAALVAKSVVSLSDLKQLNVSELPLFKLEKGQSFDDYTDNYEPTVYSYADFAGLFDDWESHFVAGWQVSSNSYLFIGNQLKPWGSDLFSNQPLVFVIEEENGQMKVRAFP